MLASVGQVQALFDGLSLSRKCKAKLVSGLVPVICGVRAAYLVDHCRLQLNQLRAIRNRLENAVPYISILYYGEPVEQTFFVHRPVLQSKTAGESGKVRPAVIEVPGLEQSDLHGFQLEEYLRRTLVGMRDETLHVTSAPDHVPMAAVAGYLLEYGVVYWPRTLSLQLEPTNLTIYRFVVESRGQEVQDLACFSVPQNVHHREIDLMREELLNEYRSRISHCLADKDHSSLWISWAGDEKSTVRCVQAQVEHESIIL